MRCFIVDPVSKLSTQIWHEMVKTSKNQFFSFSITFSYQWHFCFKFKLISGTQGLDIMHRDGSVGWVSSIMPGKLNQWHKYLREYDFILFNQGLLNHTQFYK